MRVFTEAISEELDGPGLRELTMWEVVLEDERMIGVASAEEDFWHEVNEYYAPDEVPIPDRRPVAYHVYFLTEQDGVAVVDGSGANARHLVRVVLLDEADDVGDEIGAGVQGGATFLPFVYLGLPAVDRLDRVKLCAAAQSPLLTSWRVKSNSQSGSGAVMTTSQSSLIRVWLRCWRSSSTTATSASRVAPAPRQCVVSKASDRGPLQSLGDEGYAVVSDSA